MGSMDVLCTDKTGTLTEANEAWALFRNGEGGVGAREKPRNNPMRCRKLIHNSPPRRSTRDPQLNCYPPVVQLRRVSSKAAQARS